MANNTTARNRQDVDSMDVRDRLWDSLNYSYGVKREASDKSYDQAYSQADRQALSRGMQRSSYNNQTLANISNQKVEAQNQIYNEQIADYENRLYQIERDEEADRQWQASFDEGVRQYNTTMDYNRERAAAQDAQWQKSFDEGVRQFDVGQGNTDRQFAYNYVMAMLQNGQMPSADLLAKAGLSAEDAARLMAQGGIVAGSGGSGRGGGGGSDDSAKTGMNGNYTPAAASNTDNDIYNYLNSFYLSQIPSKTGGTQGSQSNRVYTVDKNAKRTNLLK